MDEDTQRQPATTSDGAFTLSIDDALGRYAAAGLPRTPRSIQRYCAKEHLSCRLIETSFGEKWMIDGESVDNHIAYIQEVTPTGRDMSRHVATTVASENVEDFELRPASTSGDTRGDVSPGVASLKPASDAGTKADDAATGHDVSRPVATTSDTSALVAQLESENAFLRGQVGVKDSQITVLQETVKQIVERDKETNVLMQGFQKLFTSMLDAPRSRKASDADEDRTPPTSMAA